MKKKLVMVVGFVLMLLVTGCGKEAKPEDAMADYLAKWEEGKYEDMYALLSSDAQGKISKDEFVTKYEKIFSGVGASNIKIQATDDKNEEKNEYGYEVKMDTVVGEYSYKHSAKLVKEGEKKEAKWLVEWSPSLIFPEMADGDTISVKSEKAVRGQIYDRNNKELAVNQEAYELGLVPGKVGSDLTNVAKLFNMSVEDVQKKLDQKWVKEDSFVPFMIIPLGESVDTYIQTPGVKANTVKVRTYPLEEAAAHVVGYIGDITKEELEKNAGKGYVATDTIGKAGLEQLAEEKLRGQNGGKIQIVGADKKVKHTLIERKAQPGEDLHLTLDGQMQSAIYKEVQNDASSTTAMHPTTGEVLALVSSPAYDPNKLLRGSRKVYQEELAKDERKPFFNRFAHAYVPGSVFKPITSAIALDAGKLDPNKEVAISGYKWTKGSSWGSDAVTRVSDISSVNLHKALVYSDNIYFAQKALELGTETFETEAKKFGFGEEFDFEYGIEASQLANDGIKNEKQLADTAYGQGEVLMTTLHLALTYTPYVNEGNIPKPVLFQNTEKGTWKTDVVSADARNVIQKGLLGVVNESEGTGKAAKVEGLNIAGKTGTAELKKSANEDGKENSLFVGYSVTKPNVLVSMMIEDTKGKNVSPTVKVKNVLQQFAK
ncbi:penicillin-binding transpeptidase domain-containing protein [Priestia taiwanensis]|uniref:serine-type D-Ala-D-Ala carboxypeptidase n=1 Tax=Priestia taiwanensis TaxID=1347902 RepID=A0A917ET03_9BACI|nr:penicillin-binding transpeptidase domain-containing protein [Priestia taiwanensis]MBM7363540.1 penicillin-binding protein [Priestia taiwanensis]GGE76282.1 penicillin-binding protein 3 [Priestia taiwanensis]